MDGCRTLPKFHYNNYYNFRLGENKSHGRLNHGSPTHKSYVPGLRGKVKESYMPSECKNLLRDQDRNYEESGQKAWAGLHTPLLMELIDGLFGSYFPNKNEAQRRVLSWLSKGVDFLYFIFFGFFYNHIACVSR